MKSESAKLRGSCRVQQDPETISYKEEHVSEGVVKMKVTGVSMVALSQNCRLAPGHSESSIKYLRAAHVSLEKGQYSVGVKAVAGPPEEAPRGDRRVGGHEEGGCEGTEKECPCSLSDSILFCLSSSHLVFLSPSLFLSFPPNSLSILLPISELII